MIFPVEFPSNKSGHPEEAVFNALKPLSDRYDIFYNRSFSGIAKGEAPYYEIDFIIGKPNHAILVLEVKGGIISFNPQKGKWLKNHEPFDHEQAMKNSKNLLKRYDKLNGVIPISWAFCFPDCEQVDDSDQLPPPFQGRNVVNRLELSFMKEKLEELFELVDEHFRPKKHRDAVKYYQQFKASLTRNYGFVQTLANTIKRDNEVFVELTLQQQKVIEYARSNPKLVIEGVAGSGKTLIAQSLALEDLQAGKKVLFLCFNRILADLIASNLEDDQCTVNTFHGYLEQQIEKADPGWFEAQPNKNTEWFEVEVPLKYLDVRTELAQYDTIIIDEAQDFNQDWIQLFVDELAPNGSCLIFTDHGQNLFHRQSDEDLSGFKTILLMENCRNTQKINGYLNQVLDKKIPYKPTAPLGTAVIQKNFQDKDELTAFLDDEIKRLTQTEKVNIQDITLLTNVSASRSEFAEMGSIAGYTVKEFSIENREETDALLYSNPYRFKGLENDVVLALNESDKEDLTRKYVLLSRARNVLYDLRLIN